MQRSGCRAGAALGLSRFAHYDRALSDKWSIALGSYLREARDGVPEIPELVIDVPFKEMSEDLREARVRRWQRGIPGAGWSMISLKAKFVWTTRTVPIKLRLKGDWNDHLVGRKWSFRIRVRDGEQSVRVAALFDPAPQYPGFSVGAAVFRGAAPV